MINKNIQVIVPVVNTESFNVLANNIINNTHKPSLVIIINNSDEDISGMALKKHGIQYLVIIPKKKFCVNKSWNLGVSMLTNCDYVSILNDDIEIPRTFFQNIIQDFEHYPDAGAVCPHTVTDKKDISKTVIMPGCYKMKHKEGWAFTMRKDVLDQIPAIPYELKLFFGDDWFWWHTYKRGFLWYKDTSVTIFHHVGLSVRKIDASERTYIKKHEREIWYGMKNEMIKHKIETLREKTNVIKNYKR